MHVCYGPQQQRFLGLKRIFDPGSGDPGSDAVTAGLQVYAYSVAFGRQLGSWAAHDDTVACLQLLTGEQLVTASWDCSVKLWRRA